MLSENVREEIMRRLAAVEEERDVRILFAVESGSRAWGFASSDSDYDVRFIYAHKPPWYLSIDLEKRRDVIEYPIIDEIDLTGWDVRKALWLYAKSNPAFIEWLKSPITYLQKGGFRRSCIDLLPSVYMPKSGIYHYRSMAKNNYRGYLCREIVPLKKYFYVLRPLLAARWVENTGKPAPVEFSKLLDLLYDEPELLSEIHKLLALKQKSYEMGQAAKVPVLNRFIGSELLNEPKILSEKTEKTNSSQALGQLNRLFRELLTIKKAKSEKIS